MSILDEHRFYSAMLDNYGARKYFEQPAYMRNEEGHFVPKGNLIMPLHFCESTAVYLYGMQGIALKGGGSKARGEIKFFVNAAHVVFVPFGQAGYNFLKKTVIEKFDGKSVGEFLYEKFVERVECPLNGNLLINLNDEQKEYIKEFFVSFESKDEIDCSNPKDVATLVCRLYFALDALLADNRGDIQRLHDKYIEPMLNDVIDCRSQVFGCKLSNLLCKIPTREPLNMQEENYILKLFELAEKQ